MRDHESATDPSSKESADPDLYVAKLSANGDPIWSKAFVGAGGDAEYHLLGPFEDEGHLLIDSPAGVPLWSPLVSRFLDRIK